MFVLVENTGFGGYTKEFYTGKTYICQGQCYPVTCDNKHEAKQYTSEKRAVNACEKLNDKIERIFTVEKYED